jgi:hypothetical protein
MRILEILSETGTIGTTGSTTGPSSGVAPVSNAPSDQPSTAPGADKNNQSDPNLQKLAATLKQNKIVDNDAEVNDFLGAYQAQAAGKTLNPQQQASLSNLASAMLKNKTLDTNLDLQLKSMSAVKPGSPPPVQKAPGGM